MIPLASLYAVMAAGPQRYGSHIDGNPPPPPTFVPTPIGNPPGPPAATPTSGAATATPAASGTPSPTVAPTTVALSFTVDAVRVSKVNNPGNLQGLASVKPGTKVWLMLYYTINSLPHALTRVTSYMVLNHGKPLFTITYKEKVKPADVGRFSRYTVYTIPKTLPYGEYTYHATLTLGGKLRSKSWHFLVGKQQRVGRLSTH